MGSRRGIVRGSRRDKSVRGELAAVECTRRSEGGRADRYVSLAMLDRGGRRVTGPEASSRRGGEKKTNVGQLESLLTARPTTSHTVLRRRREREHSARETGAGDAREREGGGARRVDKEVRVTGQSQPASIECVSARARAKVPRCQRRDAPF